MQITFDSGTVSFTITGEFAEDKKGVVLEKALRHIAQHEMADAVYKKVAGVPSKTGKVILPVNFVRESVAFDKMNGDAIGAAKAALAKFGAFDVAVARYVAPDGTASKEATELWTKVQSFKAEQFEKVLKSWGLDEDYTDEAGVAAAKRYLQEAKKAAMEKAKNELENV